MDALLPQVHALLHEQRALIVTADPGAGKTTRLPAALLDAPWLAGKRVLVLEPRRLAARMAAARVAEERCSRLGSEVGYQVRYEVCGGRTTRLWFVTEGILTRRLVSDPTLDEVGAVVLDEFHERHLHGDVALALLRRLQQQARPDLRLVIMSATLDVAALQARLDGVAYLHCPGRAFEVAIQHAAHRDDRPLQVRVAAALQEILEPAPAAGSGRQEPAGQGLDMLASMRSQPPQGGHILVFLPGVAEIRRAASACQRLAMAHGLEVALLHGELTAAEQDRATRPGGPRRLILSTNVAESSVTIDGVTVVIDCGLARVASHSPWSGLPSLELRSISRASAAQRAGRAGRTAPGRCLRLYTRLDHDLRPSADVPEVLRSDLAEPVLALACGGVLAAAELPWLDPPPPTAWEAARQLLVRLQALTPDGTATSLGRVMASLGAAPRLARLMLEGKRRGCAAAACEVAAILSERELLHEHRVLRLNEARRSDGGAGRGSDRTLSDAWLRLERWRAARAQGFAEAACRTLDLERAACLAVQRAATAYQRQLAGSLLAEASVPGLQGPPDGRVPPGTEVPGGAEEARLAQCLLAAWPDRVARVLSGGDRLLLCGGGAARFAEGCTVRDSELLVVLQAREAARQGGDVLVAMASAVELDGLLELFIDELVETDELVWNAGAERVEWVRQLSYGQLVLDESRRIATPGAAATALLARQAARHGVGAFCDVTALERLLARLAFARAQAPQPRAEEDALPAWELEHSESLLQGLCDGVVSFAELRARLRGGAGTAHGLEGLLLASLSATQRCLLDRVAPTHVEIGARRRVEVHYEQGKAPWIASRLQDFFGAQRGPAVAAGKVPLVLHLLAPNLRAVQVTSDLAGFWDRQYPQVRRELCRRYPRHAWPEDPRTASPPEPRPRRT